MKFKFYPLVGIFCLGLISSTYAVNLQLDSLFFKHLGAKVSILQFDVKKRYILFPIEEKASEVPITFLVDNQAVSKMNVRLAVEKIDYWVPFDLQNYKDQYVSFKFTDVNEDAVCWQNISHSDNFDVENSEYSRPLFHFTPLYGWMNDPNGMVYFDGVYHLFYQYNPYASVWGNMHWGHATSRDLMHWEHQPVAIAPDAWGAVFSGSCVVDKNNTAGWGENVIVAFYTSADERQTQSIAYSTDGGNKFIKYEGNPVLVSDVADFRDPKVFWHEETSKWIMVLAVGQEMFFYSSGNLREWTFESRFGEKQGAHGGVWECPDLIKVPIEGEKNLYKWVLLCNINPGGSFGGSATQYFVGEFDGHCFKNDYPEATKWMDYGKDHYASVTWSNAPDGRNIAIAWMSNWEYANVVPTTQFRSAYTLPRDLSLYKWNGEYYLKSEIVAEFDSCRSLVREEKSFVVADKDVIFNPILETNSGAFEVDLELSDIRTEWTAFDLCNENGEQVHFAYNSLAGEILMNRVESGKTDFAPSFPAETRMKTYGKKNLKLRIVVDRSSIELFEEDGKQVMTNLVYPTKPFNQIVFKADKGKYRVKSMSVYKIK